MIDDDHVDSGLARHRQRLEGLGTAIDGDDQFRSLLRKPDQSLAGRAVALHQPVGNVCARIGAELAEQADQQGRRGRSVDVIIAEDGDRLAGLDRVGEAPGGLVHVPEDARIGHEAADRRGPVALQLLARNASGEKQLIDQIVGLEILVGGIARRPAPAPGLAEDGRGDSADMGGAGRHRQSLGDMNRSAK